MSCGASKGESCQGRKVIQSGRAMEVRVRAVPAGKEGLDGWWRIGVGWGGEVEGVLGRTGCDEGEGEGVDEGAGHCVALY